jgi:hypothetical protein
MFQQPTYYKWNFEIQQQLGWHSLLSVNYNGMHGIYIPINDNGLNAYCPPTACTAGFAGLPATVPDPRFGVVNQIYSAAISNYNGLTVSVRKSLSAGLTFNLNYTWSHALDMVSNGGLLPLNALQTDTSILSPQNPYNIRANYGNSDLDVRHYVSFGWVMNDVVRHAGFRHGPSMLFGGWILSGNIFYRTGLPYTVIDTAATTTLAGFNYGGTIFTTPITSGFPGCGSGAVNTTLPYDLGICAEHDCADRFWESSTQPILRSRFLRHRSLTAEGLRDQGSRNCFGRRASIQLIQPSELRPTGKRHCQSAVRIDYTIGWTADEHSRFVRCRERFAAFRGAEGRTAVLSARQT